MFVSSPPPPPPPAPNPSFLNLNSDRNCHNLLLESIRQGKTLKKTVTNDRSTPLISGATKPVNNENTVNETHSSPANKNSNDFFQPHSALGGLFANGIPKLKPTGSAIGQTYQKSRHKDEEAVKQNPTHSWNSNAADAAGTVRNNSSSDSSSRFKNEQPVKNRGPPPQPPVSTLRKYTTNVNSVTDTSAIASSNNSGPTVVANKLGGSTLSLSNNESSLVGNGSQATSGSYNKPTVAPKPIRIIQMTSPTVSNNNGLDRTSSTRSMITRAQSMKVPRSPSVTLDSNDEEPLQFPTAEVNQSELYRMHKKSSIPTFYQSQDSLNNRINKAPSLPSWNPAKGHSATLRHNSRGFAVKPQSKPPPPPPIRNSLTPPSRPPPPPPQSMIPPPPPHRTTSGSHNKSSLPPPLPTTPSASVHSGHNNKLNTVNNSNTPPVPPVRNSSMRTSNLTNNKRYQNIEVRYMSMFHKVEEFPSPPPYTNVIKIYNSRVQAKPRAPQPPTTMPTRNCSWKLEEASKIADVMG